MNKMCASKICTDSLETNSDQSQSQQDCELHNQAHLDFLTTSPPTAPQTAPPQLNVEHEKFCGDPIAYGSSHPAETTTKQQQQPQEQKEVHLIHTDSLKTSSDESQCEQDSEVQCGDHHSPAEKLGSERSLKASLGGKDKPSDSVDTVYFYLFNTVPSGPKTNFSTMSTPHNQAHIDSLTASPPTALQKAPLLQFGVHEN
jgi:hypothetical protein